MAKLKAPSILIDLGHVGENGLPMNPAAWFQKELDLCRTWEYRLDISGGRVRLQFDQDQLIPYWIQKETPALSWGELGVQAFLSIDSTNSEALEMARTGAPGGTLVIAEEQTAGKGRKGRSWVSTARKGLNCSLVLRPSQPLKTWPLLTHVAAVALVETLEELHRRNITPHPLNANIKWPNDVLISGKKCAGILVETVADAQHPAAVIGFGINIREGSVTESLQATSISLDEAARAIIPRRQVLVLFLKRFQECYQIFEGGNHQELLDRWKIHSAMWNGVSVWILEGENRRSGITCGLSDTGALKISTPEGKVETVLAGDVSVRNVEELPLGIHTSPEAE